MFVRRVLTVVLFASAACAPALAGNGALNVGANVVSHRPAVQAPADFPLPARSQRLTSNAFGGSWYVPDAVETTAAFYRNAMVQRGYRVLTDDARPDAVRLHWERGGERVEIRLQPVLGDHAATRLIFSANAG
ncbi:hypothetical protein AB4059_13655 [Lysobacter sp. 2RAF19]